MIAMRPPGPDSLLNVGLLFHGFFVCLFFLMPRADRFTSGDTTVLELSTSSHG